MFNKKLKRLCLTVLLCSTLSTMQTNGLHANSAPLEPIKIMALSMLSSASIWVLILINQEINQSGSALETIDKKMDMTAVKYLISGTLWLVRIWGLEGLVIGSLLTTIARVGKNYTKISAKEFLGALLISQGARLLALEWLHKKDPYNVANNFITALIIYSGFLATSVIGKRLIKVWRLKRYASLLNLK